jgi:integrase/recombinase XerC
MTTERVLRVRRRRAPKVSWKDLEEHAQADGRALSYLEAVRTYLRYLADLKRCSKWTPNAYASDLGIFGEYLLRAEGHVPLPSGVTRDHIAGYAAALKDLAPATVRRRLQALRGFFEFLAEEGHITANPVRHIPRPRLTQTIPGALTGEEVARLLEAAVYERDRCIVVLLLFTGARREELANVRLSDVDLEVGAVLLRGKGRKERLVPLASEAVKAIRRYLSVRHLEADPGDDRLLASSERTLGRRVSELALRAGFPEGKVHTHSLRHTFATNLIRSGADVATVQQLLGHANLQATARYLHSDLARKRGAVQALSGLVQCS